MSKPVSISATILTHSASGIIGSYSPAMSISYKKNLKFSVSNDIVSRAFKLIQGRSINELYSIFIIVQCFYLHIDRILGIYLVSWLGYLDDTL